ncbi:4,5-DOPA dioxygenase extradiol [Burkholderia ubonensis]|nr:4,5-DOPA dioxygenase extradiol [Burkholderia ubonensis]
MMDPIRRLMLKLVPMLALSTNALAAPRVKRMPVLFIGHGSPMNALADSDYTRMLRTMGMRLPRPRAILVVSAHWQTDWVTSVMANERPETLHDFGGFPPELSRVEYPAPGTPELAALARELVGDSAKLSTDWGLDHGTWSVLKHLYPAADIPVFQVSIDMMQSGVYHWNVGKALSELREQGVLIVASGNIVHNLRMTEGGILTEPVASRPWAQGFDDQVAAALGQRDDKRLQAVQTLPYAREAVPMPDHYWPLMYALGAAYNDGPPATLFDGFQSGTISMRCLKFG